VEDAAALRAADAGIASHGANDAARGAADLVLASPGLSTIVLAVVAARTVFAQVRNHVVYRAAFMAHLLLFFLLAAAALRPSDFDSSWPQTFSMPVVGRCNPC